MTGIDFSLASVRCTEDLKRTYNLDNLHVRQLPVERVGQLGTTFDQIICTGVLHHLADPDLGLEALRNVLAPTGAMHLMVYAPYGRTGIYMLQEFCRRIGIRATDDGIRELVAALGALPSGHPLERLFRDAPDFRSEAALADALLHPQDRAYSVPQLFDFIERAGLKFGRWVKQAPYSPRCGVIAKMPLASRLAALPPMEQYAAAELFRGTMLRHSLVVYRSDSDGDTQSVHFDGDGWLGLVPIRMPDTICVEEGLRPGAAGVLINRTHTDTDLFTSIDRTEKRILDAIDGSRSIAEIVHRTSPDNQQVEVARSLFERLWWSDQVVFDGSDTAAALAGPTVGDRPVR